MFTYLINYVYSYLKFPSQVYYVPQVYATHKIYPFQYYSIVIAVAQAIKLTVADNHFRIDRDSLNSTLHALPSFLKHIDRLNSAHLRQSFKHPVAKVMWT